jgi:hypothetical protein
LRNIKARHPAGLFALQHDAMIAALGALPRGHRGVKPEPGRRNGIP